MIELVMGNLLESDCTHICHQVNCIGVTKGSYIADEIRKKWPNVFEKYFRYCGFRQKDALGKILMVQINEKQSVVNLFAQYGFGSDNGYTDYDALKRCLKNIHYITNDKSKIGFPYRMGCGFAGGDWNKITTLINEELGDRKVVIYREI